MREVIPHMGPIPKERLGLHTIQVAQLTWGIFLVSVLSMKQIAVFLLPLDGMLVHHRVTHNINIASIHTFGERYCILIMKSPRLH